MEGEVEEGVENREGDGEGEARLEGKKRGGDR